MDAERPTQPWRPHTFVVFPVGASKTTKRAGKPVKCWDVRGRVDGWSFWRRFTAPEGTAEAAKLYARTLMREFEDTDKLWDPATKRFVDPPKEAAHTVFTWTAAYWDLQVAEWEPQTKPQSARGLSKLRRFLLVPTARPTSADIEAMDHYARMFAFVDEASVDTMAERGREYLRAHSMPLAAVTNEDLEAMLAEARKRVDGKPGDVSPKTEDRWVSVMKAAWTQAVARKVITVDPWPAVRTRRKIKKDGKVTKLRGGVQPVDKSVVASPAEVLRIAAAVGQATSGAGIYEAFVATMGLCGPRPGEARALQIKDVELHDDDSGGWLTVRRSSRKVAERWLDPHDDPEYGPLKGMESDADRTVPIPAMLAPLLRRHLDTYRGDAAPDELLFVTPWGNAIDPSGFSSDYWQPALAKLYPEGHPLRRMVRHDLRHAACSMWLNGDVPLKLACEWSGHASLSVFFDVYQGIMPGQRDDAVAKLEAYLAGLGVKG